MDSTTGLMSNTRISAVLATGNYILAPTLGKFTSGFTL